jgi:hypothetical protein
MLVQENYLEEKACDKINNNNNNNNNKNNTNNNNNNMEENNFFVICSYSETQKKVNLSFATP